MPLIRRREAVTVSPASGAAVCRLRAALVSPDRRGQRVRLSFTFAAVTRNSPVHSSLFRAWRVDVSLRMCRAAPRREIAHSVRILEDAADDIALLNRLKKRLAGVERHQQDSLVQLWSEVHRGIPDADDSFGAKMRVDLIAVLRNQPSGLLAHRESRVEPAYLSVDSQTASGRCVSSSPRSRVRARRCFLTRPRTGIAPAGCVFPSFTSCR